ncbi:DUF2804 domain-containing protein [Kurthia sibirica]|uniref:DUF2804 domain-containing protein n=1 Tax=Kurthia sibirica TaxID=202750 RepID=A0A2U3APT5_9BACL|nr:DUF2804 domain-containing protein [Kurthia sibirica]PWI26558.1 DUF2804 domain-containing protein [Kurthia sibirica]GEK32808.1 hypothetical protein KSI01_03410 [Kurthia sibirica]
MTQHAEKEIFNAIKLCDAKGNLNPAAIGYARKPVIQSNLKGHFMRKKKWNYWCIYGDDIMFSATISHLDYAAVCFVYFLDYETQRFYEKSITLPPIGKKVKMSEHVLDPVICNHSDMKIQILYDGISETQLTVTVPDFDGDLLHADLTIHHPSEDESLNVVIPWNRQTFQHTAKHHILPTSGYVKIGDKRYAFEPKDSYAVLDFGRGIWPRESTWNWAMASQKCRNHRIGLNFGGQWTDGTGMTENAFFYDGKMTKIHEDVLFEYDDHDLMKNWSIKTKFSDDVHLTFKPFFERVSDTDAKLVQSSVHQLFGYFNGYVRFTDGSILSIRQMLGSSEVHHAKW